MAYVFTVPFWEMPGWPKSRWNRGVFTAERKLIVHWRQFTLESDEWPAPNPNNLADRIRLLIDLNTEQGRFYPYPDGPGYFSQGAFIPLAYAKEAHTQWLDKEVQLADAPLEALTLQPISDYEFAVITVTYTNEDEFWIPQGFDPGLRITEKLLPMTDHTPVTGQALQWPDGTALNQSISILEFGYDYHLSIASKLAPPAVDAAFIGTVNSGAHNSYALSRVFEAGTLLYRPPAISRTFTWGRDLGQSAYYLVDYHLAWKPTGWNNQFNPVAGAYQAVHNAAGPLDRYPEEDFTFLPAIPPP